MSKLFDTIGQFVTIPNTVIKMMPQIGSDAFALFCYMRYRTNSTSGVAFPSYETIKAETGLNYRKIARAIRKLETLELMTRKKRFGGSNEYTLTLPSPTPIDRPVLTVCTDKSSQWVQTIKNDSIKNDSINISAIAEKSQPANKAKDDIDFPDTQPREKHPHPLEEIRDAITTGSALSAAVACPKKNEAQTKSRFTDDLISILYNAPISSKDVPSSIRSAAKYNASETYKDIGNGVYTLAEFDAAVAHFRNGGYAAIESDLEKTDKDDKAIWKVKRYIDAHIKMEQIEGEHAKQHAPNVTTIEQHLASVLASFIENGLTQKDYDAWRASPEGMLVSG